MSSWIRCLASLIRGPSNKKHRTWAIIARRLPITMKSWCSLSKSAQERSSYGQGATICSTSRLELMSARAMSSSKRTCIDLWWTRHAGWMRSFELWSKAILYSPRAVKEASFPRLKSEKLTLVNLSSDLYSILTLQKIWQSMRRWGFATWQQKASRTLRLSITTKQRRLISSKETLAVMTMRR